MPVRDAEYMARDRRKIAAAAAEVLVEKGVSATSIRDICRRSGVSMGGVYVHFPSKRDIIVAAMEYMVEGWTPPPIASWADLVQMLRLRHFSMSSEVARRYARLQLEFLGSIVVSGVEVPGLRALRDKDEQMLSEALLALQASGEIKLPLGLEATLNALRWLSLGSAQDFCASPDIDIARSWIQRVVIMEDIVGVSKPAGTDMLLPADHAELAGLANARNDLA